MYVNIEIRKIIGAKIRYLREIKDITQDELGAAIGLTRTSVTNLEGGKQNISIDTLCNIASALSVNPNTLMPSLDDLIEIPLTEKIDKYVKPICKCGTELLYCSEITVSDIKKIDENGKLFKNRYKRSENNGKSYLLCENCGSDYDLTFDSQNRVIKN